MALIEMGLFIIFIIYYLFALYTFCTKFYNAR